MIGTYGKYLVRLGLFALQIAGLSANELLTRVIEEDVARNSILMYDPEIVAHVYDDISELESVVQRLCNCQIEHLPSIQALILHYKDSAHLPASIFNSVPGITFSDEDEMIMPPNDEISEDRMLIETERQSTNPDDTYFDKQWALGDLSNKADINWREGHAKYLADNRGDGASVIVAVIDTGVDYNHPDLKGEMWKNPGETGTDDNGNSKESNGIDDDGNGIVDDVYGANFVSEPGNVKGDPMDKDEGYRGYGHGTHCAGVIAATASNGKGIAGIAGNSNGKVKIMAVRSLGRDGGGSLSWLLAGLNYAISNGAKISSNSWGGRGSSGVQEFTRILNNHAEHLFISAAGNENAQVKSDFVPCAVSTSNQLCVGSSTEYDSRSSFSNYDSNFVHVFAPGSSILSTYPKSRLVTMSGTSMACPQVSGLAALIMTMKGDLTPAEVKRLIEQNVQTKSQYNGLVSSGGLIDVNKTVCAITNCGGSGITTTKPTTTTSTSTTTEANDEDDESNCTDKAGWWARRGCQRYSFLCTRNGYRWFAYDYCPKTCGNCGSNNCQNKPNYTEEYCSKYLWACKRIPWFREGCKKTCNAC